jgi:hypothetical protein
MQVRAVHQSDVCGVVLGEIHRQTIASVRVYVELGQDGVSACSVAGSTDETVLLLV